MKIFSALLILCSFFAQAQFTPPPPVRGIIASESEAPETKPADPIQIQGKKAEDLNSEETRDFLQEKVRTISQQDGEVELLRLAPGYPLTLSFSESLQHVVVGDPKMLGYQKMGKTLVLSATAREGDTSIQVFFSGNQLRVYHLFIEPNFSTGETAVRVNPFSTSRTSFSKSSNATSLSRKEILEIIRNYDLLIQNKAIQKRDVQRIDLFRKSRYPGFTYFCLYRFTSGTLAVTFSYQNTYSVALRTDESKIRIELGHQLFIPDYVSLHKNFLMPQERTTGLAIFDQLPFSADQPFEFVCR